MINEDGFYYEMIIKDLCDTSTWTMSCCIMGLRIILLARILPFICPFFIQFSLFLNLDCLEFVLQFSLQLIYCSFYIAVLY